MISGLRCSQRDQWFIATSAGARPLVAVLHSIPTSVLICVHLWLVACVLARAAALSAHSATVDDPFEDQEGERGCGQPGPERKRGC